MSLGDLKGFVDGATLTKPLELTPEVVVVGSGAGGAVTAHTLAAAGFEVLIVEEGGHFTRQDFDMREDTAYPRLYQEDGGRATEDLAISILQGKSVGGSTTVNWTTSFRTPTDVLEHWTRVHGVRGFSEKELVPHWEAIEERLHIAEIPLEEINENNRTLYRGAAKLGYDVKPLRRNVKGCLKTGFCGLGCPVNAKQGMLVTYLPDAVALGAVVLSRCRIDRGEIAGNELKSLHGTLLRADGVTPSGQSVTIRAKHVVLAGGAINTPALLMKSGFTKDGLVGARTFLHPTVAQLGMYPGPVLGFFGAPQSVASHHFVHRGDEVGYVLETAPIHPMLASLAMPGIGKAHAEGMKQLPNAAGHIALHVDGFHADVPGGRVKVLKSGAPKLDYPIPEKLLRAIRDSVKTMARIHLAAGADFTMTVHDPPGIARTDAEIEKFDALPYRANSLAIFSAHVMGGSQLNDDPAKGVVSSETFGIHGLSNAHVIDGSVFPTSLGVNPQLTIYGLARLAATRLVSAWKKA